MAYIDSANIKGTLYELQDTQARTDIGDLKSKTDNIPGIAFLPGNNLLPLRNYHTTFCGIEIDIKDGILTLNGTATDGIRVKLSGEYECATSIQEAWKSETLPQFEAGKTYSIHNVDIVGTKQSGYGVNIRNAKGSVISESIPESTLSAVPAFAMLYIPMGTTIDNVSYIPFFIEGTLEDSPYYRELNSLIAVDGVRRYKMPDMSKSFIYDSSYKSAMKFPSSYKPFGTPTPLLILGHGLSSTISSSSWGNADMTELVGKFTASGYAVLDVNQITSQDWVNPALIKRYVAAINRAMQIYNVIPKVVFCESMGSMIGLCLATLYSTVQACVCGGIRLDMAARYAVMTNAQKAIVNANLGFPEGTTEYIPRIAAGWDKTAITLYNDSGNKVCPNHFPPTFFVVGDSDNGETSTKEESIAKIIEIKRGGTICTSKEYVGGHSDVCYLKTGTSYDDAIAWFNTWI